MLSDFLGLNLCENSDKPVKQKKKKDGEFENYYEIENMTITPGILNKFL